jgi:putative ABC transport system substrate-binding protein
MSKILICMGATVFFISASIAQAQQPNKVPRIGFLIASSASTIASRTAAFRQGLRDLGYHEGKNIVVEWRSAEGQLDRQSELANELVRLKLDVIVTAGPESTRAAKNATSTIPIIMAQDSDPVGSGFVASLGRPGGNITGLATFAPEISAKQLELLKEIVPKLSRVAVLGNLTVPGNAQTLKETELAAAAFAVQLQSIEVHAPKDIESAFRTATVGHADALLVLGGPVLNPHRRQVTELAVKSRLAATYTRPEFVEAGGLMTYGASYNDSFRRAATYVDKVLKGAKPNDLPIEQPTKFELVINLKAAKQIGLTIPSSVLAKTDRVIK